MATELVIFDCDGVLVDTEPASNRILAAAVSEAGLAMDVEQVSEAFEGMLLADIVIEVERRLGRRLPEGWLAAFEERRVAEFRKGVKPIPGVADALIQIGAAGIPVCVGSQARREKTELTLDLSGLIGHFDEAALFASGMVERGKPHPDLFLFAARSMGCDPGGCVVVEDGVLGARAGGLARMSVLGYAPDGGGERLACEGARTFESMAELPALLGVA